VTRNSSPLLNDLPCEDAVMRRIGVVKRFLLERLMSEDGGRRLDVEIALSRDLDKAAAEWSVRFIDVRDLQFGDRYRPFSLAEDVDICIWDIEPWGWEGAAYMVRDVESGIPLSLCCRTFDVLSGE